MPNRSVFGLVGVVLIAGCGVSQDSAEQAEEVHSVAAEAALLAHDAAEGSTTGTFTREHAEALREVLGRVRDAIEDDQLGAVAAEVDETLLELAAQPADEERGADAERKFERLAEAAEDLAG